MSHFCFHCGSEVALPPSHRPARGDSCDTCGRDLRACKNCQHYDTAAYNQCREPSAERVVDKEKANFCDYFVFCSRAGGSAGDAATKKKDTLKSLDDLFKK